MTWGRSRRGGGYTASPSALTWGRPGDRALPCGDGKFDFNEFVRVVMPDDFPVDATEQARRLAMINLPLVRPARHCPPRHRHAFGTLVACVTWHPMTLRATSGRPYATGGPAPAAQAAVLRGEVGSVRAVEQMLREKIMQKFTDARVHLVRPPLIAHRYTFSSLSSQARYHLTVRS